MNMNLTLLGQMITFSILVWVTMRFIWPPLMDAMEERRLRIQEGEKAAKAAQKELANAKEDAVTIHQEAQKQKEGIVSDAHALSKQMVQDAKKEAKAAGERMIQQAEEDIRQQSELAKSELRKEFADLVVQATESLLKKEIDADKNHEMINSWLVEHE